MKLGEGQNQSRSWENSTPPDVAIVRGKLSVTGLMNSQQIREADHIASLSGEVSETLSKATATHIAPIRRQRSEASTARQLC